MTDNNQRINRNYGYDILINTFEPFLRTYIVTNVIFINYGPDWKSHIPKGVLIELSQTKEDQISEDCSIDDFFEETTFLNLKDILVASNNFKHAKSFFGELNKEKFTELMDELNIYRRKIAHAKSTFGEFDLLTLIENVKLLCQGESAKEIMFYLENEGYKNAKDIPVDFFEEYECQNNLPPEEYDLDGGFVGREKEKREIKNYITSEQDRIITVTGAGGVGKTAIALKVAHSFLMDSHNPFDAIIWFSAKTDKLTEEGIVPLIPGIRSDDQLIEDILSIADKETLKNFKKAKVHSDSFKTYLYNLFSSQKCLLIIDNLETIIRNDAIITFIKDIPRPSQVLITSRKGLGEIERRYPLTDMLERDAIQLFRIVAKQRNKLDLLRLENEMISELVKRVKCYPLLIKWSIGQVCLGKDIDEAFSQIFAGDSEIARFSFNDVFSLLSKNSKILLFSMIVYGEKPISKHVLMHLANLNDDQFDNCIKELVMTSFVYSESTEEEGVIVTKYSMLSLTGGFVEDKLDENETDREMLLTRYHHLSEQIQDFEKAKSSYSQSLFRLGIRNSDEKLAFNYVKTAKNYYKNNDIEQAEENFELAIKIAPKFSYALSEFSKFEFNRNHVHKALELAKKAVEVGPENYHPWFNYGIMLRRNNKSLEAIESLKKAKQLNPNHLPICNELGRAYNLIGNHEKAETEFKDALKEEKYPNYRHKIITLQFLSENYRRWAESFRERRDSVGQIKKLRQAHDTILEAIEISSNDYRIWKVYRKIFRDLGIALCTYKGFSEGKPYLEKSFQTFNIGKTTFAPDSKIVSDACFYLASFCMNERDRDIKQIEYWINKGLKNCTANSKEFEKLNKLKKQLLGKVVFSGTDRKYGCITSFNTLRKFGIVESGNETHLFLISGFRQRISKEESYMLEGRIVSFILIQSQIKKDSFIADDIAFEEDE